MSDLVGWEWSDLLPHIEDDLRMNDFALPTASGIYKITCIANKKIYIGSALNLRRRQAEHFSTLRQNKHHNSILQNAWNKYGEQTFIFEILELVLPMSLTAREQYWFNKLKPFGRKGFNIARDAVSPTLGNKRSPETIEKMRQGNLGRKHTPETREKVSRARLGNKSRTGMKNKPEHIERTRQAHIGREVSPETRKKMRQSMLGRKPSPEAVEKAKMVNIGRKHTSEEIEKQKQSQRGRKHTSEHIEKQRQAKIGMKHAPESIERMKQSWIIRKRGKGTSNDARES